MDCTEAQLQILESFDQSQMAERQSAVLINHLPRCALPVAVLTSINNNSIAASRRHCRPQC